nr:MAG TPA: hypothetical protein [Caudoviricetes sp.]
MRAAARRQTEILHGGACAGSHKADRGDVGAVRQALQPLDRSGCGCAQGHTAGLCVRIGLWDSAGHCDRRGSVHAHTRLPCAVAG